MKIDNATWFGLIAVPFVIAVGQILFKMTAVSNAGQGPLGLLSNVTFWIAIVIYGSATIAWIATIESVPISRAYLFVALTYLYVPLLSWIFLREQVTYRTFAGMMIVIVGIVVSVSN
ncbi:EamA family transporter [uncultured Rhodoblastus sp.]|uniref:EamA family transporter n=1 Tax=uncultured Rhodoblastus sp. TaxID=543037 RepID=UPI0025F3BFF1|nr:EamA family transporter [uncultured Rhodoblastus sp.]